MDRGSRKLVLATRSIGRPAPAPQTPAAKRKQSRTRKRPRIDLFVKDLECTPRSPSRAETQPKQGLNSKERSDSFNK